MPENAISQASSQILQYGVLGVVALTFAFAIAMLYKRNEMIQDRLLTRIDDLQSLRIQDAREYQTHLLGIVRQCAETMVRTTQTLDMQHQAMAELRDSFRGMCDDFRVLSIEIATKKRL